MYSKIYLLVIIFFSVQACTTTNFSPKSAASVKTVSFPEASKITYSQPAKFMSHGQGWAVGLGAGLGGAVGAAIASAAEGRDLTEEEFIDIALTRLSPTLSESIAQSFKNHILAEGQFTEAQADDSDASFNIEVVRYGIFYVPFTKSYRPRIIIRAKLTNKAGKVVWKKEENSFSALVYGINLPTKRREEWFADPELIKDGFEKISNMLTALLSGHIHHKRKEVLTSFDGYTPPREPQLQY